MNRNFVGSLLFKSWLAENSKNMESFIPKAAVAAVCRLKWIGFHAVRRTHEFIYVYLRERE